MKVHLNNVPEGISAEDHAAGLASSVAHLANYLQPGAGHSGISIP